MNPDDFPLSVFEVDCDGSACGSGRGVGLHVHPPQDGHAAWGRVVVRDHRRTGYGPAEGIARLVMQEACAGVRPGAGRAEGEAGGVMAVRRCWWCGLQAEVDTELPESGGMVKDTDSSWICSDGEACGQRAYADMLEPGYQRNKGRPAPA